MTSTASVINPCPTCRSTLGLARDHGKELCHVRASFWCSQCSCYGHRPSECTEVIHTIRPRTLEELIPADVREQWGIKTETLIVYEKPTIDVADREIDEFNIIEVRYYDGKMDSRIREVMRAHKVPTVHKMDENLLKLRKWAHSQGKKVRLIQEKRPQ